ncbi:hypothetical protein CIB48_g11513 [Xylaria polymorpha]|nr:hypothetical protein CIB48_g11513 [Xylaria polymorpha]
MPPIIYQAGLGRRARTRTMIDLSRYCIAWVVVMGRVKRPGGSSAGSYPQGPPLTPHGSLKLRQLPSHPSRQPQSFFHVLNAPPFPANRTGSSTIAATFAPQLIVVPREALLYTITRGHVSGRELPGAAALSTVSGSSTASPPR